MENNYLYIEGNTWSYCDSVFNGIATLSPEKVSDFCLYMAEDMRYSDLGNYDDLSKDEREKLAQLWETAKDLPMVNMTTISILKTRKKFLYNQLKNLQQDSE